MIPAAQRRPVLRRMEAPPIVLAALACQECGHIGVTVVAMGHDCGGALGACFCSIQCARPSGYPWL